MTIIGPERIRQISHPAKFGTSLPLFNEGRVASLQRMIQDGLPARMQQKWDGILAADNTYQPVGPIVWELPPYYDDPVTSDTLTGIIAADVTRAVDLGVRWRMLGDPADAAAVARIITPWAEVTSIGTGGDTRLVWSNKWPMFIQAVQLIQDSDAYTPALKTSMENLTALGLQAGSSAYLQTENRAMWGVVLEIASAGFLGDRDVMLRAIDRWRALFENDVKGNIPIGETRREQNGLYYCNFLLNAMTQAAELARFNGEWLYDIVGSDGSTFKGLWQKVARWTALPIEYPYWPGQNTTRIQAHVDPLHALWPTIESEYLIEQYTTTTDVVGYRGGVLAYRGRPLWG